MKQDILYLDVEQHNIAPLIVTYSTNRRQYTFYSKEIGNIYQLKAALYDAERIYVFNGLLADIPIVFSLKYNEFLLQDTTYKLIPKIYDIILGITRKLYPEAPIEALQYYRPGVYKLGLFRLYNYLYHTTILTTNNKKIHSKVESVRQLKKWQNCINDVYILQKVVKKLNTNKPTLIYQGKQLDLSNVLTESNQLGIQFTAKLRKQLIAKQTNTSQH